MIDHRDGKHYGFCESCNLEWELTDKDLIDCWNPEKCAVIAVSYGLSVLEAEKSHKHLAYPFYLCEVCRTKEMERLPRIYEVELA